MGTDAHWPDCSTRISISRGICSGGRDVRSRLVLALSPHCTPRQQQHQQHQLLHGACLLLYVHCSINIVVESTETLLFSRVASILLVDLPTDSGCS